MLVCWGSRVCTKFKNGCIVGTSIAVSLYSVSVAKFLNFDFPGVLF